MTHYTVRLEFEIDAEQRCIPEKRSGAFTWDGARAALTPELRKRGMVIGVGGVFDELRGWLLGFSVPGNPLRLLGMALSSTMVIGFVVGLVWGLRTGADPLLSGGLVALAAAVTDETLALMHGVVRRVMPSGGGGMPMPMPSPPPPPARAPGPPTEEEVHAQMDAEEDAEVEALTS